MCSAAAGCAVIVSCLEHARLLPHMSHVACVLAGFLSSAGHTRLAVSSPSPRAAAARTTTQNATSRSSRGTSCELCQTLTAGRLIQRPWLQQGEDSHASFGPTTLGKQNGDLRTVWCAMLRFAVLCCALCCGSVSRSANNIGSIKGVRQGIVQQQHQAMMMVILAFHGWDRVHSEGTPS